MATQSTVWGQLCGSLSTVKPRKWVSTMIFRPQKASACKVHSSLPLLKIDGMILNDTVAVFESGFSFANEKTRMLSAAPRSGAIEARKDAVEPRSLR